ncbi:MAG: histidine phosphatase family protein [Opitutales bacterium]|nr:histidine phosphatase family protein [Opitutales bacterium]
MKKLLLVRHAKSSWDAQVSSDFDRPLNDRGKGDAPRVAEFLKSQGFLPDQIYSSAAVRAATTAKMLAKGLELEQEKLTFDERIYMADLNHLQAILREIPDELETIYLVGHNPTITDCANALCGDSLDNIPTCGTYAMELDIESWKMLRSGVGKKLFFQRPKEL